MKAHPAQQQEPSVASSSATAVPQSKSGLLYVCIAVCFFSTSAIFVRWSKPFNSVEIAFWRLAIATIFVAILGCITHQPLLLKRQQVPRFLFYGLVTALHFIFYIASLSFTTIAHSLAITYTSPIFVTLFSALILREPLAPRKSLGIGLAIVGVAIMAGFELHYTTCSLNGQCMILGDGLAVLSALCFSIYSIAGRGERDRHPLFRYTTNVYGLAALWLLPAFLFFAFQHSYSLAAIGALAALGIFPLGLGHTLYNAAIRKVHATYANLIATQEVTGGVILGVLLLHEIPSLTTIIGGIVTLVGIMSVLIYPTTSGHIEASEIQQNLHSSQRRFPPRNVLLIGLALLLIILASIKLVFWLAPHSVQSHPTAAKHTSSIAANLHNPYTHTGTLVLDDALNGSSNLNKWEQGTNADGASCLFIKGAYHVSQPNPGFFHGCIAHTSHFSNFVYQVQMTVLSDSSGGILFRTDLARSQAYYFSIDADSSYTFWVFSRQIKGQARQLTRSGSIISAFHAGLYQTNTLAVVANGSILGLYVNLRHVATFHDLTLSSGQIGVFAEDDGSPAEVVYSNALVWTL